MWHYKGNLWCSLAGDKKGFARIIRILWINLIFLTVNFEGFFSFKKFSICSAISVLCHFLLFVPLRYWVLSFSQIAAIGASNEPGLTPQTEPIPTPHDQTSCCCWETVLLHLQITAGSWANSTPVYFHWPLFNGNEIYLFFWTWGY